FLEPAIRLEGHAGIEAEKLALLGAELLEPETFGLVRAFDSHAKLRGQRGGLAAMVEMAVGDENLLDGQPVMGDNFEDVVQVAAGIDDGSLFRFFTPDDGAVLLEAGDGDDAEFHVLCGGGTGGCSKRRASYQLDSVCAPALTSPNRTGRGYRPCRRHRPVRRC